MADDPRIRRMVQFSKQNLIEPWPAAPPFDLILLRNVTIYFDTDTRAALLKRIAERLIPGGFLLMGAAESPVGISGAFIAVAAGKGAVFQKR